MIPERLASLLHKLEAAASYEGYCGEDAANPFIRATQDRIDARQAVEREIERMLEQKDQHHDRIEADAPVLPERA